MNRALPNLKCGFIPSPGWPLALFLLALSLSGCARPRDELRDALQNAPPVERKPDAGYKVASPDVLLIQVSGRPELNGRHDIQSNGCIDLGPAGGLHVEGLTSAAITRDLASLTTLDPAWVHVSVEQFRSKQVYLFGEVTGLQRAVNYEGPETIIALLRRTGGIKPEAAPDAVRIVRNPDLAKSEPEVISVDLRAILLQGDERTNVTVQPYDQIYVPETKHARTCRCLHPWLRAVWRLMAG